MTPDELLRLSAETIKDSDGEPVSVVLCVNDEPVCVVPVDSLPEVEP